MMWATTLDDIVVAVAADANLNSRCECNFWEYFVELNGKVNDVDLPPR